MPVKRRLRKIAKKSKQRAGRKTFKASKASLKSRQKNTKSRIANKPRIVQSPQPQPKPRKNYKLPNYKKKCIECAQFKFIKGGWSLCMQCYEKRYGKYLGEDRFLYVIQQQK